MIFQNPEDFLAINSYSSVFMVTAILGGLFWVVVKAHLFHDTLVSPAFSAKLFAMNMDDLIHTTEIIYSQSFVWLSYSWLATVILGLHSYFGLSYLWVFLLSFGLSVLATALLAFDIEKEITAGKNILTEDNRAEPMAIKFEQLAEEILG